MKLKFRIPQLDTMVWVAVAAAGIAVVVLFIWLFRPVKIVITNNPQGGMVLSPLTGKPCADATRRPIAVMLASDPEARPLSGIADADAVFEMPVTPNGITRMMAVFQCGADPKEIGSIRSARGPFVPLAQGLNVVLAHWGGERDVLAQLNAHVIDNVDAMLYEGTTFYRKRGIPAPHDGFSTLALIRERADKLGYTASASVPAWPHENADKQRNLATLVDRVAVSWPQNMDIEFRYDDATNTYLRWRGGQPEMDTAAGRQVRVSTVIVMETDATFLYDQYINMRVTGQGVANIYQDGRRISALWKKAGPTGMLTFVDSQNKPIALAPGQIWIAVNAPLPQAH